MPTPTVAMSAASPAVAGDTTESGSWGDESYLGGVVIDPGKAVNTALQEISEARAALRNGTWGSGNPVGGVVSIVPQVFLAQAEWSLTAWQNSIGGVQESVARTVGVPVIHQLAQMSLLGTMLLPAIAEVALDAARVSIPVVGLFAPAAAAEATELVAQARQNGRVYGVVPFIVYGGNEIAYISVNGGPRVPVVIDTGSSGLSITRQYVGTLGEPTGGQKEGGYGDGNEGVTYSYEPYAATISFGNGIVTGTTTVNVVTPETEQAYNNYQYGDGVVGVLGIAANNGDGPNVNVALPGELKDGVLIYRFGSFGFMVLGPNPLPARATTSGAANTYTQVRINGGPPTTIKTIIDSGGQTGDVPASLLGTGQTSGNVPAGTRIAVYTADGRTLLYSYTTAADNSPTVNGNPEVFNTGFVPFTLAPIYLDYSPSNGLGDVVFNYR